MNGQPEVAAVVVTYNRLELLERVLDALEAQTYPVGRVYVIDNAGKVLYAGNNLDELEELLRYLGGVGSGETN